VVAAFYWNAIIICKNATNLNIYVSRGSAATHLRVVGNVIVSVANLTDFPAVKEFGKLVMV